MASLSEGKVAADLQPKPQDYRYDLDRALAAVVGLRAIVPEDAYTAETLGTERAGNGVLIRPDGVILTIGYLIAEAETIWLTPIDGRPVPGHVVAYDFETGFGLVQALARLDLPQLPLGRSAGVPVGEPVVIGGAGGRQHSLAAQVVARQEFAGYWEYVLDEALFTQPAHPNWGGTALIGPGGELIGIGSLQVEQEQERSRTAERLNVSVPIDLLNPILDDLLIRGRANRPPRPWLGLYAAAVEGRIVVVGLANGGPAQRAGVATGDIILAVGGAKVSTLAGFFRRVWSLGAAGVEVPLTVHRDGSAFELRLRSAERGKFLKAPRLH
jgi:S1-C subfamily serine protease